MNQEAQHYPAIVCLASAGSIWKRLKALQAEDSAGPEFLLTRAPGNADDVLALCRRLAPALLVTGEEQLPQLPPGADGIRVLLLPEKSDHPSLELFFRQGCPGLLSSQVPDETLLRAVRSLFSGELRLADDGITNREVADRCLIIRETVREAKRLLNRDA